MSLSLRIGAALASLSMISSTGRAAQTLTANSGMTVYVTDLYVPASRNGAAGELFSAVWPPVPAGAVAAGRGIGAVIRDDGTRQAVHEGRPLFFYSGDRKPGDMNGDNLGGVWHAVRTRRDAQAREDAGFVPQCEPAVSAA
jgi:predicted lipoprotein with Yx(FWY)xxD motif